MTKNKHRAKTNQLKSLTFWQALRAIREAQGLTQAELAEAYSDNADAPWISRVEAGKKDISFRTALKIANALGVEMHIDCYRIESDDDAD